jgi:GR25 family glycosyltransferase involved in LPS biosynthesis
MTVEKWYGSTGSAPTCALGHRKSDMNGLPPMHLINLDRSTDRLRHFRERNGHLENVVRVPAVDGSALDREALISSGYINRDLAYASGTLGCAMSHLKLWEMAASQNQSITIFEDDIVIAHQFEKRAREVMSGLSKDWDIIHWGYGLNPSYVWVDLGVSRVRLNCYGRPGYQGEEGLRNFQAEEYSSAPVKLLHSFGMLGYSISPKGARAALEYCLPLRQRMIEFPDAGVRILDRGIDTALDGEYPTLQAFICVPPLLIAEPAQESVRKKIDAEQHASRVDAGLQSTTTLTPG